MANNDDDVTLAAILALVLEIQEQMEDVLDNMVVLNDRMNDLAQRVEALEADEEPDPH